MDWVATAAFLVSAESDLMPLKTMGHNAEIDL
jgi:hypothetical protein